MIIIQNTPLRLAVLKRNYDIIRLFLNHKDININIKNTILKIILIKLYFEIND